MTLTGAAVDRFGLRLDAAVAAEHDEGVNVVVSPLSVAIALAMLEPGATGDAMCALHEVLGVAEPRVNITARSWAWTQAGSLAKGSPVAA